MPGILSYVVVTPARNEGRTIELTLRSVVAQTVLPLRWVIVSDGSIDDTDEIVERYARQHDWIELLRMPERRERSFAGKALALNAGTARVEGLPYEVIASLDADVSFDADYFAFLLEKLAADPELGVVGTPFRNVTQSESYDYRFTSIEHVSGACQVFRRDCFKAIGGYQPVKGGAIDNIAVVTARMNGWKTRTFQEKVCLHYRKEGTAQHGPVRSRFQYGIKDYTLGHHPVWEICRSGYQMTKRPFVLGGLALGAGYLWALLRRFQRPVSREFVAFHRREQVRRLKNLLWHRAA